MSAQMIERSDYFIPQPPPSNEELEWGRPSTEGICTEKYFPNSVFNIKNTSAFFFFF